MVLKMPSKLTDDQLLIEILKRSPPSQIPFFTHLKEDPERIDFCSGPLLIVDHSENDYKLKADKFIHASMPDNTIRAYMGDLHYFISWYSIVVSLQEVLNLQWNGIPLSINDDVVLQFIFHHLEEMPNEVENALIEKGVKRFKGTHALATVKRRLVSLTIWHKMHNFADPCDTKKIKDLLAAMAKKCGPQKKSKAITKGVLENLLETCEGGDLIEIRDKALLLFGFSSGGRRRSEISEAMFSDFEMDSDGNYIYRLPKSKTDQEGKGNEVPLKGKAAKALKDWLDASKITDGKIFRSIKKGGRSLGDGITTVDINRIVKKRCEKAGYDPDLYSAHSLRSGFVTEAGKQGCPIGDVMQMTTHTNVNTVMKYYRAGNIINNKAADLL